ncbi:B12-binding domain-containing radical SAM protein [Halothermothrix orenii]|uniref:Radical SAM domain protein n=1 Tax=Halothermothrix orenii (strain H 168 / OCM 544 / DSM 9562) TaxID=373903 RepID=B8CXT9_HALOH|nr:radical SAM protein [Halothermothrix orenii]ACL70108.1 Radical SAM domain protein [Halothermothrix orenii H 168]
MKKKLLLINPSNPCKTGLTVNKSSRFPPLGLGIIAALTPSDWNIKIVDENFDTFRYEDADLVGLTAFTSSATRAYEIAKQYRERGIPTIIGGIHASMMPDEAKQYVDTVVIGEAEGIWPEVISDFEEGKLKKIYQSKLNEADIIPKARHDLFHPGYMFGAVQTARGCPMDCEFCSVTQFNGYKYRQRPIKDVLDELESIPQKMIFFVDDNILGHGKNANERAIKLFKGMINRGIKKEWFCQASINFAENEEVLKYAAKSGCKMVFIGLEAEDVESLDSVNKKMNIKVGSNKYKDVIDKINSYKIAVLGSFIYGLDNDTIESLQRRIEYIIKCPVDVMQTTILTPLPGTRLFKKLSDEGRLLYNNYPDDWVHFDMTEVTYNPVHMTPEQLSQLMSTSNCRLYSMKVILSKFFKTLFSTKSLSASIWALSSNFNYRNVALGIEKEKLK